MKMMTLRTIRTAKKTSSCCKENIPKPRFWRLWRIRCQVCNHLISNKLIQVQGWVSPSHSRQQINNHLATKTSTTLGSLWCRLILGSNWTAPWHNHQESSRLARIVLRTTHSSPWNFKGRGLIRNQRCKLNSSISSLKANTLLKRKAFCKILKNQSKFIFSRTKALSKTKAKTQSLATLKSRKGSSKLNSSSFRRKRS